MVNEEKRRTSAGGKRSGAGEDVGLVLFDHLQAAATVGPFGAGHVGFDQQNAAAGAFFEVFFQRGIGDGFSAETGAFVFYGYFQLLGGGSDFDANFFLGVFAVAVLDGVDEGFFEGDFDAELALAGKAEAGDVVDDAFLDFAAGVEIGGDGEFEDVFAAGGARRSRPTPSAGAFAASTIRPDDAHPRHP